MIYLIIQGGLGNQLYQAGFGLLLERLSGRQVRFLTHRFQNYSYGFHYELEHNFPHLHGRYVHPEDVPQNVYYVRESDEKFNSLVTLNGILEAIASYENLVLDGYWSDERLWDGHIDFYREILMPQPEDPEIIEMGRQIRERQHIGIHVRRHEYGHMGVAQMDYYRNALQQIRRERGALPALVFTDEYNVCNFEFQNIPDLKVIKGDSISPIRDFYALTQCSHFIASNSTFSGLATQLGETDDSIVYYPYPICVFHNGTHIDSRELRWRIVEDAVRKA